MPLFHAFELEDQRWFPRTPRDYATEFPQVMIKFGDSYSPAAEVVRRGVEQGGADRAVDLGSGGGGP